MKSIPSPGCVLLVPTTVALSLLAAVAIALSVCPSPASAAAGVRTIDEEPFGRLPYDLAPEIGRDRSTAAGERRAGAPGFSAPYRSRDTLDFGFYELREGVPYAVLGGIWTWDHGAADPLEGWTSVDLTLNSRDFWRQVTEASWLAAGNPLPWPQISGDGMALCGADLATADSLGWVNGIGYGNHWCQWLTSPTHVYEGSGTLELGFLYFNDTETGHDYTRVLLLTEGLTTPLNGAGFDGRIGVDTAGNLTPAEYARIITEEEMGGGGDPREFQIRFEFRSDGGYSDEDGSSGFDSFYGAFGVDSVYIGLDRRGREHSRLVYGFDGGLEGWTTGHCPGVGSYLGVAHLSSYEILDPCQCELSGYVLELHDPNHTHPEGQHEMAVSPIMDRKGDLGDPQYLEYNRFMADWDMYSWLPQTNGVFYRTVWSYYPYEDPNHPGIIRWSPPTGNSSFYYTGENPLCDEFRNIATDWAVPPAAEKVKLIFELYASCEAFEVDPCSGETNATPLFDNVRIRNVHIPHAPALIFEVGARFQDGFGQGPVGPLSTTDPGNANIAFDLRYGFDGYRLGDSLGVVGPVPTTTTQWESRLWFRLKRTGPGQQAIPLFHTWRDALANSPGKPADFWSGAQPAFTWGYMDSVEAYGQVRKNKFLSQFRDGPSSGGNGLPADADYNWGGGGEQGEGNEILPDLCFTPGTKIEYFITSNYTCLPGEYWYLPDTTGGNFAEFEILPSFRMDGEIAKFPCLLYVDAFGRGDQLLVDRALHTILTGASVEDPIPDPAPWDRYDYLDAPSSWCAPLYRGGATNNNGATLYQLLGYRLIYLDAGPYGAGAMDEGDWRGLRYWLESPLCETNTMTQGLVLAGSSMSELIQSRGADFLTDWLGAAHNCAPYHENGCPPGEPENDQNYCVRLDPVVGAPPPLTIPIDLFGNWCPDMVSYSVVQPSGPGQGSRVFAKVGSGAVTEYAQVINDRIGSEHRYRTVLTNASAHVLTARDLNIAPDPDLECPSDRASRHAGVVNQLSDALLWTLDIPNPSMIGLCALPPCPGPEGIDPTGGAVSGALVDALYPNRPNPFNPRTSIRYSLAQPGPAKIVIYDVAGRAVRTLVDAHREAGAWEAIWDGTDDKGRRVGAGVYWSRLETPGFTSNRKMVVMK